MREKILYEELETEHGTFTSHEELGMSAKEYYMWWLQQLDNQGHPLSLEEVYNKISNLEAQNIEKDERIQSLESLVFEII